MRLFVCLLALALANAATVPQTQITPEKNLKEITEKGQNPLDNVSSEQELIDQANIAKDVENNLRKGASDVIPVAVVVEQAVKSDKEQANEVGIDCDDANNIKRVEIDLKNTGPPQRIEHDTQNPEHFDDGQTSLENINIKQEIIDTENTFNDNAQNIQQTLQNWLTSNQHIANLQKNFQTMKESVEAQISHMNQTIHKYLAPTAANIQSVAEGTKLNIQAGLKTLEKNVQSGMKVLTNEIKLIGNKPEGSVKAEGEQPKPPGIPGNNQWLQPLYDSFQNFTTNMQNQMAGINALFSQFTPNNTGGTPEQSNLFSQFQQNIQNIFQGQQTQQDESSPPRPGIWQNIQSIFTGQAQPTQIENDPVREPPAKPNRPIVQAIQTGLQNVQNIIRPPGNTPAQAQPAKPEQAASDAGSNVVPEKPAEPEKQPEKQKEQPEGQLLMQSGPIKQMIERNPIMQGLAGAVQRIQHTIRPTSPREASDTQKGHHGESSDGSPINSNGVINTDLKPESPQKEPEAVKPTKVQPELPQKEPEVIKPAIEDKPAEVPVKEVTKKTE